MLHGLAGWSAPLLLANPKDRFSRVKVRMVENCHERRNDGYYELKLFALWEIFHVFCCTLNFFFKNSFRNTMRVLNSLDPDQA